LWPRAQNARLGLGALAAVLLGFTWLPRPRNPAAALMALDARERAVAYAESGDYDAALQELAREDAANGPSASGKEMAEEWRFARVLKKLPTLPAKEELEAQMLSNAAAAMQSPAAQFRCGACLWLLGQHEGALFYWRGWRVRKGFGEPRRGKRWPQADRKHRMKSSSARLGNRTRHRRSIRRWRHC